MIGNGDSMRITSEIAQDLLGPAEGGLCINNPVLTEQRSQKCREALSFGQGFDGPGEDQTALPVRALQSGHELSPEYFAENFYGQEERILRVNPMGAIPCESSARNDTVNVRMEQQVLSPCMENAEKTDLRSKVFRIPCHLKQCFGHRSEQQAIEFGLVLQDQRVQFMRQGEHHMEITRLQQFLLSGCDPALPRLSLTFWAVAIPARVIGDGLVAATSRACIDMATESRCTAMKDGPHHL